MAVRRLSEITKATSAPALTDTVVGVGGGTTDLQYTLSQVSISIGTIQPAGGNLQFFVATTGSDSNPGTVALPFATIQHAVLVAAGFDYGGLYFPTIFIQAGTFNITQTILLPELRNLTQTAGQKAVIQGNAYTTTSVVAPSAMTTPVFRADGIFSTWKITQLTADADSCLFEAINEAQLSFDSASIGLNDSSGFGDVTFFQAGSNGKIGSAGGTFHILASTFFAFFENTSFAATGIYGLISLLTCTVILQPSSLCQSFAYTKQGDFDCTYKYRNMTYTNAGSITCAQAIVGGSGGFVYIITDNGELSDLPGQSTNNVVDNTVYITNSNSTKFGSFVIQHSGIPTTSQISTGCWGIYKDTSGGGVYLAVNDAGTIKKVALT